MTETRWCTKACQELRSWRPKSPLAETKVSAKCKTRHSTFFHIWPAAPISRGALGVIFQWPTSAELSAILFNVLHVSESRTRRGGDVYHVSNIQMYLQPPSSLSLSLSPSLKTCCFWCGPSSVNTLSFNQSDRKFASTFNTSPNRKAAKRKKSQQKSTNDKQPCYWTGTWINFNLIWRWIPQLSAHFSFFLSFFIWQYLSFISNQ